MLQRYFACCLLLSFLLVSDFAVCAVSRQNPPSLMVLKQYVGQMPKALLEQEPLIGERLSKLLGKEYPKLQERLANETPIQLVGNVLILLGEKPYAVGNPKAIIGIELSANRIHCALMEHNSRSIYSEDHQKIPSEFNSFIVKKDISDGKKKKDKNKEQADEKK